MSTDWLETVRPWSTHNIRFLSSVDTPESWNAEGSEFQKLYARCGMGAAQGSRLYILLNQCAKSGCLAGSVVCFVVLGHLEDSPRLTNDDSVLSGWNLGASS